jgi:hypothetical protein
VPTFFSHKYYILIAELLFLLGEVEMMKLFFKLCGRWKKKFQNKLS